MLANEATVVNELLGLSLEAVKFAKAKEYAHDDGVQQEEGARPYEPANQRIVIADDRVLDGVGQQQQDDEVERIELRQLAFAREAKPDQQKGVDDRRANDLLAERNIRSEEGVHLVRGNECTRADPSRRAEVTDAR